MQLLINSFTNLIHNVTIFVTDTCYLNQFYISASEMKVLGMHVTSMASWHVSSCTKESLTCLLLNNKTQNVLMWASAKNDCSQLSPNNLSSEKSAMLIVGQINFENSKYMYRPVT